MCGRGEGGSRRSGELHWRIRSRGVGSLRLCGERIGGRRVGEGWSDGRELKSPARMGTILPVGASRRSRIGTVIGEGRTASVRGGGELGSVVLRLETKPLFELRYSIGELVNVGGRGWSRRAGGGCWVWWMGVVRGV
jgi:hypothetical protein